MRQIEIKMDETGAKSEQFWEKKKDRDCSCLVLIKQIFMLHQLKALLARVKASSSNL